MDRKATKEIARRKKVSEQKEATFKVCCSGKTSVSIEKRGDVAIPLNSFRNRPFTFLNRQTHVIDEHGFFVANRQIGNFKQHLKCPLRPNRP